MPPKIRELIAELEAAGFVDRGGKGKSPELRSPDGSQAGDNIRRRRG
jgi:hypothetical protein